MACLMDRIFDIRVEVKLKFGEMEDLQVLAVFKHTCQFLLHQKFTK